MQQEKKTQRGVMSIVCALTLTSSLALSPLPAIAQTESGSQPGQKTVASTDSGADYAKKQVVYTKLDAAGVQQGVYVSNAFDVTSSGTVDDYGSYENVTNQSDNQELKDEDGSTLFQVKEGNTFYYQGDMPADTEQPWDMHIIYRLDGTEIDPDRLAGADGALTMELHIERNEGYSQAYSDNYLLQVSTTLDADHCTGVDAPEATLALSGSDTALSYMVLPGSDAVYKITAQVSDFSFDGFQIVGVPLDIALDLDEADVDTSDLDKLSDGIASLDSGARSADEAASALAEGASQIDGSTNRLMQGTTSVTSGVAELSSGLSQVSDGVSQLAAGSNGLAQAMAASADGVTEAQNAYDDALASYKVDPTQDNLTVLLEATGKLASCKTSYGYYHGEDEGGFKQLDEGLSTLRSSTAPLESGAERLLAGGSSLEQGIESYTGAVGTLSNSLDEYAGGIDELSSGSALLADSSENLGGQVTDAIREKLESYLDPDFSPTDFVNAGNDGHVKSVQFVYKTAGIDPDSGSDDSSDSAEDNSEDNRGFWGRLAALFSSQE